MKTESFGNLSGKEWEDICNKLFNLRYKDYHEVPARYGGDYGIEGFTFDGLLFQCYCPEDEEFSSKSLYELQRDKITKDIKKLIDNIDEIRILNKNQLIENWYLVTPAFDSKHLIEHCRKKEELVQQKIGQHVTQNFKIIIQTEDSYIKEIAHLVNANFLKIESVSKNYTNEELEIVANSKSEIVDKIKNKLIKLDLFKNNENKLNRYTFNIFKSFLEGEEELSSLNKKFPNSYDKLLKLKNSIEKDVENKSIIGIELKEIGEIQENYKKTLEKH